MIFYGGLHPEVGNGRRALVVFLGFGVGETELELGRSMMLRTLVRCRATLENRTEESLARGDNT